MRTACRLVDVGLSCSLGSSASDVWPRLLSGDRTRLVKRADLLRGESRWFGQVREELPQVPDEFSRFDCRNNRIALLCYEAIRPAVEKAIAEFGGSRVGVVVGSSTAGVAEAEIAVARWEEDGELPRHFDLLQLEYGGLSEFLSRVSGASGPGYALSTACSTGAKALASARSLLALGVCDAVIAGSVDSLCQLTAGGFHALQAMSAEMTNPMSRNRSGLTLGEGGALFVLTREEGGIQLAGVGESSDAHHISAPDPEGRGAEACMRGALEDAALEPAAIDYLNLHGTGTLQNDAMESAAVARVFERPAPCSSTKPLIGHTLGASGSLEAAFCWLVLAHREGSRLRLPPHRFDGEYDEALAKLDLVGDGRVVDVGPGAAVLSNSFGFGGSNCALVLRSDA